VPLNKSKAKANSSGGAKQIGAVAGRAQAKEFKAKVMVGSLMRGARYGGVVWELVGPGSRSGVSGKQSQVVRGRGESR
jgi:hypothetical protein